MLLELCKAKHHKGIVSISNRSLMNWGLLKNGKTRDILINLIDFELLKQAETNSNLRPVFKIRSRRMSSKVQYRAEWL